MIRAGSDRREFFFDALHVFVLTGFAIAQPLYDLLGRNAEFFVAHRLGAPGILALAATLSFGLPALLVLMEWLAGTISLRLRRAVHVVIVFLLVALILAPVLARWTGSPIAAYAAVLFVSALAGAAAYMRIAAVRAFVSLLSPGIVAFPVLFLVMSPVSALVWPRSDAAAEAPARQSVKNPVPIVFIVFDEFEAGALLDENKEIDPVRFPNFAALAKSSWWFPRATTVWWETQRAIPAILTGLRPRDSQALPSLQSHPNNIFTWLAGTYTLNVREPLTNLCPPKFCQEATSRSDFEPSVLLSDLAVAYAHTILPRSAAETYLPAIDAGWRGFVGGGAKVAGAGAKDGQRHQDRLAILSTFIDGIKADHPSTLNFLHVLLPHTPYAYLPSGATYPGGDAEGLGPNRTWVNDDHLPTIAYQRYMLQLGAVDTMVGRLIARLKAIGLYDRSLIVITADHGKSFRPGQRTRTISAENASDLLQIPLFIKMRGQTEGRRSDRKVLSVDILPTIASALDTELPWAVDGLPATGETYPDRPVIEIPPISAGSESRRYDADDLTSYPRLAWKLENFGSRTPLSETRARDPFSGLLGKSVADIEVREGDAGYTIESDQFGLFDDVQPEAGVVPILIQGRLQAVGSHKNERPVSLAFAVNGIVQNVTKTTEWADSRLYFMAMVPETALRKGRNEVEVFEIAKGSQGPVLTRLPRPSSAILQLNETGQTTLIVSEGRGSLTTNPAAVKGHLDEVGIDQPHWFTLSGWASDAARFEPVDRVVVFSNGVQVYSGRPSASRPDLVRAFGRETLLTSGFRFNIPRATLAGSRDVRIFGITRDGVAGEIVADGQLLQRFRN